MAEIAARTAAADATASSPNGVRAPIPQMHTSRPGFAAHQGRGRRRRQTRVALNESSEKIHADI